MTVKKPTKFLYFTCIQHTTEGDLADIMYQ